MIMFGQVARWVKRNLTIVDLVNDECFELKTALFAVFFSAGTRVL